MKKKFFIHKFVFKRSADKYANICIGNTDGSAANNLFMYEFLYQKSPLFYISKFNTVDHNNTHFCVIQ